MTRLKTRTARVYLWLSPAEKAAWNRKAASLGLDLNEYIRRCVERRAIAAALPEVNLNQQVRAMGTVEEVYQAVK